MDVKGAHFMKEDIALFDATFFNFTADVAGVSTDPPYKRWKTTDKVQIMDPQVRLQLESVYEAMESGVCFLIFLPSLPDPPLLLLYFNTRTSTEY
jgi:tRNA G10  N-methylase Trm11